MGKSFSTQLLNSSARMQLVSRMELVVFQQKFLIELKTMHYFT